MNASKTSTLPWVHSLSTSKANDMKENKSNTKHVSIFSWNILAQYLFDSTQKWYEYVSPSDPIHKWSDRWIAIQNEIQSSQGDIICLQEVEFTAYEEDILPSMRSLGYDGRMQNSKSRRKNHGYGVATFWRADRFHLRDVSHHSRTMLITLEDFYCDCQYHRKNDNSNDIIAILNCHLEGNPTKTVTRVRQLQSSLRDLKNKFSHQHLVVCGDFNCQLGQSACSTYLHYGVCSRDIPITEWGRPLTSDQVEELHKDIKLHEYNFSSAYPLDMIVSDPLDYITYVNAPGRYTAGLDQIWYHVNDSSTDTVVGLRHPFHSAEHRHKVLQYGLPSRYHPSDHMPIGCILEWKINICADQMIENEGEVENRSKADILEEIATLLDTCQFASDKQQKEFDFIRSPVDGIPAPKGQKPTQDQIRQVKERREMKKRLWEEVPDDVKQTLERIIVLTNKLHR